MSDLDDRLSRIYAAINVAQESDIRKFSPKVFQNKRIAGVFQDFRGGMSDADLANATYLIIQNIANLEGHLRRWVAANSKDKGRVNATVEASSALKIIKDLANSEKHGYRDKRDHSGLGPKLVDIRRELQLQTQSKPGSSVGFTTGPTGPRVFGDGSACVRMTADVVDKQGARIGDLLQIEQDALSAWEGILVEFGVLQPGSRPT